MTFESYINSNQSLDEAGINLQELRGQVNFATKRALSNINRRVKFAIDEIDSAIEHPEKYEDSLKGVVSNAKKTITWLKNVTY